jgi:hypothetical protein
MASLEETAPYQCAVSEKSREPDVMTITGRLLHARFRRTGVLEYNLKGGDPA